MNDQFLRIFIGAKSQVDHAFLCQECYDELNEEISFDCSTFPTSHHDESIKLDGKYIHRYEVEE